MKKSLSAAAMVVGALMLMASAFTATAGATDGGEENCDGEWISAVYEDVLVKDGYTEVVKEAGWQRYSWKGGPHRPETPPVEVPPHKNWQANTKSDPHGVGKAGPYFRSKGNKGNGDWFYLERVPAVTVEHPPVYENRKVKDGYCVPDETTVPDTTVPPTTTPPTTEPPVTTPPTTGPPVPDNPDTVCSTEPELCEPTDEVPDIDIGTPDSVERPPATQSPPVVVSPPTEQTAAPTQPVSTAGPATPVPVEEGELAYTGPSGMLIGTAMVGLGLLFSGLALRRRFAQNI